MQHRRPDPGCPLCPLWGVPWRDDKPETHRRQHTVAEELWAAWDGSADWERKVIRVAAEHGIAVSVEQARIHFSRHRIEQPYLSRRPAAPLVLAEVGLLSPRNQEILRVVYRQRLLSREQAIELFFLEGHRSRKASEVDADRVMTHFARRHLLYRWYPPTVWPKSLRNPGTGFAKSVFYFAGRALQPWVESTEPGPVWPENFVGLSRQVGLAILQHDIACTQVFVDIVHSLRAREGVVMVGEGEGAQAVAVRAPMANWFGSRQTRLVFYDQRRSCDIDMKPDGFASLAVERSGFDKGAIAPCQLPFFYEFDRGNKEVISVAQQMLDYHRLAVAGAVGERFPDLAVPGYATPMLMLFPDRKRLETVVRSFLREAAKEGFTMGAPILVGVAPDWSADPFAAELIHAWDGRPFRLLDALLLASRRLRETGSLLPHQTLRYHHVAQPYRKLRTAPDLGELPDELADDPSADPIDIVNEDDAKEREFSRVREPSVMPGPERDPDEPSGLYNREEEQPAELPAWAEDEPLPEDDFELPEPASVVPELEAIETETETFVPPVDAEPERPLLAPTEAVDVFVPEEPEPVVEPEPEPAPVPVAPRPLTPGTPGTEKPTRRRRDVDIDWGNLLG